MLARQSRGGGTEPLRQRAAKIDDCLIQNPAYRFTHLLKLPSGGFIIIADGISVDCAHKAIYMVINI